MLETKEILNILKKNYKNYKFYIITFIHLIFFYYIIKLLIIFFAMCWINFIYIFFFNKNLYPLKKYTHCFILKTLLNIKSKKSLKNKMFILVEFFYRYFIIFIFFFSLKSIYYSFVITDSILNYKIYNKIHKNYIYNFKILFKNDFSLNISNFFHLEEITFLNKKIKILK